MGNMISLTAEQLNTTGKNVVPLSEIRANDRGVKRSKVSAKDRKAAGTKLAEAGVAKFVETDPVEIKRKADKRAAQTKRKNKR